MIILVVFNYLAFNFRTIFGFGIYNLEDDYNNSYSDGTAGINLHIRITHIQDNQYYIYTFIEPISTGNVVNYGLLSIEIYYMGDNHYIYTTSVQFDPPSSIFSISRISHALYKNENFSCNGIAEVSYETGGIPKNDTINFQLNFIMPYGLEDYLNLDLALYVLFFLPFFLYVIIPIVLNWIFRPVFGLQYSEEEMKRDEKYLQYLHEHIKQKRKEERY